MSLRSLFSAIRFLCAGLAAVLLWPAAAPANGEDFGKFYEAYAIVTGTDLRQRPWGFAQCLREVLVKVSGDPRLKDDPRTLGATAHAANSSNRSTMST